MRPPRTYDVATCPKRQNTTLAHLLRDSSFDPQFCLSWGIRFEAFFDDFFCSQNGGGRGKASDPAAWRCRLPSIGAAEAGFVRNGILGKPSLIYDICHPRALKLSVMALRRAGDSVLFSNQVHASPKRPHVSLDCDAARWIMSIGAGSLWLDSRITPASY